jgi:regulator of sigma E protease
VLGLAYIIMIVAVISLTLAIMNVLPIPALDGGRLFVILFFHGASKLRQRIQGKPLILKQATEDWIHGTGFVLLMLLFVLITFVDINRFF